MSASDQAFNLAEVERGIAGTRFAGHLHHLPTTSSTNQRALEEAAQGASVGAWIADEQTAGRGRSGHAWHSAAGEGLYLSVLVEPGLSMANAGRLPLATGLAVQAAIEQSSGLRVDLRWPNDLMLDGRKAGGILAETTSEPSSAMLRYAVIGIGINVNHTEFAEDLRHLATSLRIESGRTVRREDLVIAILQRLDVELERIEGRGLIERFEAASTWAQGKHVQVAEGGGYTGVTCGLDPNGFLLVRTAEGGIRVVLSGGVRPFEAGA